MADFSKYDFNPVMNYPEELYVFDLSRNYDPEFIRSKKWAIGKYNEKRTGMYKAKQYRGKRNIHMGIDIWTEAGAPVFSFYDGRVAYMEDHKQEGNYGPTLIIRYALDATTLFALYGHLSRACLKSLKVGEPVEKGQKIAELGSEEVNGGWVPHLHFQLSNEDPGQADMPGVVANEDREEALQPYPDPRIVLGDIY
jgi:murein DD-endopeptidase MepM/ murein hydrolase activator NlpD